MKNVYLLQTENYGTYSVHSSLKKAKDALVEFCNGEIGEGEDYETLEELEFNKKMTSCKLAQVTPFSVN
jgi:hypothetical protein